MKMTVELFDSIINTSQDCVFWKDKDRRFLGVNQAFLDFYGFESADILIGKNDEDMGWHSDPEPYKQDELMVLAGRSTYKVQGKCMVKGEERDIIASKRPLYDGDEIIGLVGSFVDITDVLRRQNKLDGSQVLYSIDKLRKFSFFDNIIDEIGLDEILDPLTGVLSRAYSMKFIHSLLGAKIPFTFSIIDLDNFKHVNDTFGHSAGDMVLTTVSKGLAEFIGEDGLIGRFGGDELLMIDLKNLGSKEKECFFESLYGKSKALRVSVSFDNGVAFVTATTGIATFPDDADNFTDLFGIVDKMLYIGKDHGRNCYTIYEAEKYNDIEIRKVTSKGIYNDMHMIKSALESVTGFEDKLKAATQLMLERLKIKDMYYAKEDGRLRSVLDPDFDEDAGDIGRLMTEDIYRENNLEPVKKSSPNFYDSLIRNDVESVLIVRIRNKEKVHGYLVCAAKRSLRIWQESECALLFYLSELLG